ncbi:MAG: hypothetical protein PHW77_04805 [Eubacteriales bacterium]|nr:hypothetical protein [Eubacteriales bacterium]
MKRIRKNYVSGLQIEFRFERFDGEYIISVFYAGKSETVSFPDIEDEVSATAMFDLVANGNALPGTVKDVLEDYCFRLTIQNHF